MLRLVLLALSIAATDALAQTTAAPPAPDYGNPQAWLCRPDRLRRVRRGSFHHRDRSGTAAQPSSARGWIHRRRWIASTSIPRCRRIRRTSVISSPTTPSVASCDCSWRGLAPSAACSRPCTGNSPSPPCIVPTPPASSHPISWALGYQDVRAAWRYYLAHDNGNRGIVLIGHSQGTVILTELIRREIEGTPVQSRIVSAFLIGGPGGILVPRGKDVGGTFAHMPLCRAATQTGCVVAYSSFRSHRAADGDHALRAVGRLDTRRGLHQSRGTRRRRGRPQRLFRRGRRNCPAARPHRAVDRWRTTHCDAHRACGGAVEGAVQVQRVRLVSRGVGRAWS